MLRSEWLPFAVLVVIALAACASLFWQMDGMTKARDQRHVACLAVEGHFVVQSFGSDECWSADGTRRLFPWEGQ